MEFVWCQLDLYQHCEDKFIKFLKEDGKDEYFGNVRPEYFSKWYDVQDLQSFIPIRCPDLQNSKLQKKVG